MQYCFACPAEYYRRRSNELGLMFIFIRKSAGEITEPCGTPAFVEKDLDDIPSTTTLILRFVRKLSIRL